MSKEPVLKFLFNKIKYICCGLSIVLAIWLSCYLFIPSIGGPFPYRTRGPFAEHRYYKLAELPDWEDQIKPLPGSGKTRVEELISNATMTPLHFGKPEISTYSPYSATPAAKP